jgi:AcrR family transcriptional regulator
MAVFQRARSEAQREARRQAILGAAAAMLAEMPVAEVTLNELSRRAGLAKSNVLRYFESREAVLLELLDATIMITGALWPHTQPSAAMLAAYEADPELAAMRLDFTATIREVVEVISAGLLARDGRREH